MKIDSEERYKEVNLRLKKLVAEERRSLQQVRQNYTNEVNSRTEIELVLRECVEEVRREGERRRAACLAQDAEYSSHIIHLFRTLIMVTNAFAGEPKSPNMPTRSW